jgi:hypothetical protein
MKSQPAPEINIEWIMQQLAEIAGVKINAADIRPADVLAANRTEGLQLAVQVMRANAGFHANQARRHVGKPHFDLAARPLLPQHDRAASIEADDVERILANIDTHRGNGRD